MSKLRSTPKAQGVGSSGSDDDSKALVLIHSNTTQVEAPAGQENETSIAHIPPVPLKARSSWADDDILTAEEAAEYLRCEVKTLYNYKCAGKIPGINRGQGKRGRLFFRKYVLDNFLFGKGGR